MTTTQTDCFKPDPAAVQAAREHIAKLNLERNGRWIAHCLKLLRDQEAEANA